MNEISVKLDELSAEQQEAMKLYGSMNASILRLSELNAELCSHLETMAGTLDAMEKQIKEQLSGIKAQYEEVRARCDGIDRRVEGFYSESRAWKRRTMKLPILSFEVHLVEHCNLNCKGCDHFCSLAEPAYTDIEIFQRDFDRLSELFHQEAGVIHLLGGEPLLNPQIEEFCKIARKSFPRATINIITNGILLPQMPDSFWSCCHEFNITVRPTKYPIQVDYQAAEEKARVFKVKYEYFNDAQQVKTMTHNQYDLKGWQDPRESFMDCYRANKCIYLANGKLYPCTFAPNFHHFNHYFGTDIPESELDFIDIFQATSAVEILDFLSNPIPFCRFCDIRGAKLDQPWDVSERKIEEWT